MITDKLTTLCRAVALNTGGAGSYVIGDAIDIGDLRDIGQGTDLYLVVTVETTLTSGGSATLQIALTSDDAAANHATTSTVHATSAVMAVADGAAGASILTTTIPWEGAAYERYLCIRQITAGAAFTAGKINAYLTPTPSSKRVYAEYAGL
jgi:hypothetical protein